MCRNSSLEGFAEDICAAAKVIEAYRLLNNHPPMTFETKCEGLLVPEGAPQNIYEAKQTIIEKAARIQHLAIDPIDFLPNLAIPYQQLASIRWLCHFHIISCIPLDGSIRYAEAASICSVPEDQLRSVARMAIATNFLREESNGELAHNAVSASFVKNPSLADWALFMTGISMPVAAKFTDATAKWGSTQRKNETAMNLALGTDLPLFDYVGQSPETARLFAAYMKNVQSSDGMSLRHLVAAYDWEALGDGLVIDVGGSTGAVSAMLAEKFPRLHFVVQDLPETVANGDAYLQSKPQSVQARIKFQGHNFFEPQPVQKVNIFLLRMIIHDWPQAEAAQIIQNLVPALRASGRDARLLIQDTVLPVPGSIGTVEEAQLRVRDLTMMQSFNSKERELSEFSTLLNMASDYDGRLVLKKVRKPPGSQTSVLEVAYEPKSNGLNGDNYDWPMC